MRDVSHCQVYPMKLEITLLLDEEQYALLIKAIDRSIRNSVRKEVKRFLKGKKYAKE